MEISVVFNSRVSIVSAVAAAVALLPLRRLRSCASGLRHMVQNSGELKVETALLWLVEIPKPESVEERGTGGVACCWDWDVQDGASKKMPADVVSGRKLLPTF